MDEVKNTVTMQVDVFYLDYFGDGNVDSDVRTFVRGIEDRSYSTEELKRMVNEELEQLQVDYIESVDLFVNERPIDIENEEECYNPITVASLDDDVNPDETLREYIRNTEEEFSMRPMELDEMEDQSLKSYVDFLDYLWTK